MNDEVKISFLGDIMCEEPLLKASLNKKGEYNFDKVFEEIKYTLLESDYVVGNLETVCCGENYGLTDHIFNFNTPKEFLTSIKSSGINLLSTATNHSLDRGIKGLKENIKNIKASNLEYIGTNYTEEDSEEIFYKDLYGINVAFLNYTYGTNVHINENILDEDEIFHINMLQSQDQEIEKLKIKKESRSIKSKLSKYVFKVISLKTWLKIKKMIGIKHNTAYQDNDISYIRDNYLKSIQKDIENAKLNSDIVIVCMHSGGQFNSEPGDFSKYMMKFMAENGVDLVVGNHPHVVQRHQSFSTGMLGLYSLGNFSISPSSVYLIHDNLPEYSIMFHTYLDKHSKMIKRYTFSILKIVEENNGSLKVHSVHQLMNKLETGKLNKLKEDVLYIYNTFTREGKSNIDIQSEYILDDVI